jgi:hypothetical protein
VSRCKDARNTRVKMGEKPTCGGGASPLAVGLRRRPWAGAGRRPRRRSGAGGVQTVRRSASRADRDSNRRDLQPKIKAWHGPGRGKGQRRPRRPQLKYAAPPPCLYSGGQDRPCSHTLPQAHRHRATRAGTHACTHTECKKDGPNTDAAAGGRAARDGPRCVCMRGVRSVYLSSQSSPNIEARGRAGAQ